MGFFGFLFFSSILAIPEFRLEKYEAEAFLSREKREYGISGAFETNCIEQTCDSIKFFEVRVKLDKDINTYFTEIKIMPLEEPSTVMRKAQYKVCLDFIDQLKNGCPGLYFDKL